jgi:hypothetical protein
MKTNNTTALIKDSVRKLYEAQKRKKKVDEYYNEVRKKEQLAISNYIFSMLQKGENSFDITLDDGEDYYADHVKLKVTRVRKKSITWDIDKLKKKLDKKVIKKIITKKYTINDMSGLVEYLKECGVNPKKFKKFLTVDEELNEVELNRLYDLGEIDKEQVNGCYKMEMSEPYIKLTEQKQEYD